MSSYFGGEISPIFAERGTVGFQFVDPGGPDTFPQAAEGVKEAVCPNGGAISIEWEEQSLQERSSVELAKLAVGDAVQVEF